MNIFKFFECKNSKYFLIIFLFLSINSTAQVGIGTQTPNTNAMLDIDVSSLAIKKGFMPPRMTTSQKNTLGNLLALVDEGMLVFDTTLTAFYYWNGSKWLLLRIDSVLTDEDSFGNMFLTTSTLTNISHPNTPTKIEGVTACENLANFNAVGNNRLVYTGTSSKTFSLVCSMSFGSSNKNDVFAFYIYKGGSSSAGVVNSTKTKRYIAATSDVGALTVSGLITLKPNEWVEVWAENLDNFKKDIDLNVETFNLLIY